jgi:hypothetical protein
MSLGEAWLVRVHNRRQHLRFERPIDSTGKPYNSAQWVQGDLYSALYDNHAFSDFAAHCRVGAESDLRGYKRASHAKLTK